jgi:aminoglycoside phosphotransferase (APT) family kinase protein
MDYETRAFLRSFVGYDAHAMSAMVPAEHDFLEALRRVVSRIEPQAPNIAALTRLSAGATNETWSFDANAHGVVVPLIMRRAAAPRDRGGVLPLSAEAAVLALAHTAGVPTPAIRYVFTPDDQLGEGFLMERIAGATIPSKILRAPELADARDKLAAQLGTIAAGIHRIDPKSVPALPLLDAARQLALLRSQYETQSTARPVFELAFRWLREHLPAPATPALVHGDYRHGNLIIGSQGVRAVLDWELAHLGDPIEDLAWLCIPPWRFGELDKPVGGFGNREDLWAAYERAGGVRVDAARCNWWEVLGSLRWGIMCAGMPAWFRSGRDRSIERAMIGRRASESELDLLRALAART